MSIIIKSASQNMDSARCRSCCRTDDLFNIEIMAGKLESAQFHLCRGCLYELVQAARSAMHGLLDTPIYTIANANAAGSHPRVVECWFYQRDGDDIVLATAPQENVPQKFFRCHYEDEEKCVFKDRASAELALLDILGIQADCGDDKRFPKLREALFQAGHEAIADFLGYKFPEGEAKEATERRLNGARLRMSRPAFEHWVAPYNIT